MSCNECAQSNLSTPFADKATVERARMTAKERIKGYNCAEPGRVLAFSFRAAIIGTADGKTFTNSDLSSGDIDFIRLQPYGNDKMRVHGILIDGLEADIQQVGYGEIRLSDKEVQPTMKGTLQGQRSVAGRTADCDRYYKCGVDTMNSACLPSFNEDNPMDIALNAFDNNRHEVDITVLVEYI